jgi:hypothetical protein
VRVSMKRNGENENSNLVGVGSRESRREEVGEGDA